MLENDFDHLEWVGIRLRMNGEELMIFSYYNPPGIGRKINTSFLSRIASDTFILAGDLNAKMVGDEDDLEANRIRNELANLIIYWDSI